MGHEWIIARQWSNPGQHIVRIGLSSPPSVRLAYFDFAEVCVWGRADRVMRRRASSIVVLVDIPAPWFPPGPTLD